jgi:hypothetical protein
MNNLGNLNLSLQNYSEALRFHLVCKETVAKGVNRNSRHELPQFGQMLHGLGPLQRRDPLLQQGKGAI